MATELIQDFSGGINNHDAPNRIATNELATAQNCWYNANAIGARGAFKTGVSPSNNAVLWASKTYTPDMSQGTAVVVIGGINYMVHNASLGSIGAGPIYNQTPDVQGDNWKAMFYNTGTVSTTSGSAVITGSGTAWLASVRAGDIFSISSAVSQVGQVLTVDSDTQITLGAAWSTTNAPGTFYSILPAFSNTNVPSFEMLNNQVFMTNKTRMPIYWDGSVVYNNTNSPICLFYKVMKNYLFGANTTANPSRLSWSTIKTPTTWPASNFIDVSPDDGQQITGLFYDGQSLLILKRRSVYKLSGDIFDPSNPTYVLTKVYSPPQCVFDSAKTWGVFKDTVLLYGGNGIYQYNGNNITRFEPTNNVLTTFTGSSWTAADYQTYEPVGKGQQAIVFNENYWITSKQTSYGNILMLDKNLKWWSFVPPNTTDNTFDFFIMPGSTTSTYNSLWTIVRNTSTGVSGTYLLDQSYTNESINASFTTRVIEYGKKQRFGRAYLHFKRYSTGSITFGYSIDEGTVNNVTVDMTIGTGTRVKSPPIIIGQVGQSIQFVISHNSAGEDFEVYAIEFEHQDLRV